ncbi:hypothetical protein CHS0354_034685, partial [Potamilus streckersoni]
MLGTYEFKPYFDPIVHACNATKNDFTGMFEWHLWLLVDAYLVTSPDCDVSVAEPQT